MLPALSQHRACAVPALLLAVCALGLALVAPAAHAQLDLSGNWTLSATGVLPDQQANTVQSDRLDNGLAPVDPEPCVFEGGGTMTQNGSQLSGQATLMLISGPAGCPAEMMANLDGSLDGNQFGGTLDGGQMFGILDFVGIVSQDGQSIDGTYTVRDGGPFQNVQGDWSSSILRSILQIPTLGGVALGLLALLLASASVFLLRRAM